jgi:hypothetical protein
MLRAAKVLGLVALCALLANCVFGGLRANPGYAAFGSPGLRDTDREFALSLGPLPMKVARMVTRGDPEMATMLQGVKAVRVRIYDVDGDAVRVQQRMEDVRAELVAKGWNQVVAVRDDGELVTALVKMEGSDAIRGMAVVVQDDEDVVLVNVIGDIRPESFSALMAELDLELPSIMVAGREPPGTVDGERSATDAPRNRPVTAFADPAP